MLNLQNYLYHQTLYFKERNQALSKLCLDEGIQQKLIKSVSHQFICTVKGDPTRHRELT